MSRLAFAIGVIAFGHVWAEPVRIPDTSKAGALEVSIIITDAGKKLFRDWGTNPPGGFEITNVSVAKRNKFLTAIVLFSGCKANAKGNCNARVDYVLLNPTGKTSGELRGGELWVDKAVPGGGTSQLAIDYMGVVIDPPDPAGEYRVQAIVRDLVANEEALVERRFKVE